MEKHYKLARCLVIISLGLLTSCGKSTPLPSDGRRNVSENSEHTILNLPTMKEVAWATTIQQHKLNKNLNYFSYQGQETLNLKTESGLIIGNITLSEADKLGRIQIDCTLLPDWKLNNSADPIQIQSFNMKPLNGQRYPFKTYRGRSRHFEIFEANYLSIQVTHSSINSNN
jgi:hypothetical protein